MEFKSWLNESSAKFEDIADAIKRTLEFIVTDGTWKFEPRTYGLSGMKTISVAGHFYCNKGHFFLTAHADASNSIDTYDSKTGQVSANSKVEIIASVSIILGKNSFGGLDLKKIAERSNDSGDRLNSPYQLAIWTRDVIDNYGKPDDGEDESPAPTPTPSNPILVGV